MSEIDEELKRTSLGPTEAVPDRQLVVNWHLTEACNYECDYCYAKWVKPRERELIHDGERTRGMLGQLFDLFRPSGGKGSAAGAKAWRSVRLNLAGGEPLLYRKETLAVVGIARELGFEVSMITNGSLLDRPLLEVLVPKLCVLGVSLDSAREEVNREIGRADKRTGQTLGLARVEALFRHARELNPRLQLKTNTVVNALNWKEDMTQAIRHLAPDKWKVLQMLPVQNSNLAVSDEQFGEFVGRHSSLAGTMTVEDNDSMIESYIMIDPFGRFFQNRAEGESPYRYSRPILQVGAREAFSELPWSEGKFLSRYPQSVAGERRVRRQAMSNASTSRRVAFPIRAVSAF